METLAIVLAILFVGEAIEYQTEKVAGAAITGGILFFAALAISIYTAVV